MREYNTYDCYYYIDIGNKELVRIRNTACWAGINGVNKYYYTSNTEKDKWGSPETKLYNKPIEHLYVSAFRSTKNSLANTKALVNLINNITECKIVTIKKQKYIKYKLINKGHYYSNLLLLNFLRMVWYEPNYFNYKQFFKDIRKKDVKINDSLYFLMDMTRINVLPRTRDYGSYLNHSLITPDIVPKNSKLLFEYKGDRMDDFLTQKIE